MTLAEAVAAGMARGLDRLDAQLLLLHALGRGLDERAWLIAHDTDPLGGVALARFMEACARRAAGEPLAYIVGRKEFFGLDLRIDARVLVPRPETETLVEWALEVLHGRVAPDVIDLGTGSGAIALAIKSRRPDAHVWASDRSAAALEVASANAHASNMDIAFRKGVWLAGIARRFDLIVSNPPYIAEGDQHLAGLAHEPSSALVSGPDGLADLRAIVDQAPSHLVAGGWLLLEHGHDQAEAVAALLADTGFQAITVRRDIAGIVRCCGGRWLELG